MFEIYAVELRQTGSVRFYVRARPGMAETKATSVMDDGSVKIDIAAAPEDGKANAALIRYLAEQFGVPKDNVTIVSGMTARMKLIRIDA